MIFKKARVVTAPSIDFSPFLDKMARRLQNEPDDFDAEEKLPKYLADIIVIQPLREHLAAYFSGNFIGEAHDVIKRIKPASCLHLNEHFEKRGDDGDEIIKGLRPRKVYPLSTQELTQSAHVYGQSYVLPETIAAIQSGLLSYINAMGEAIDAQRYDDSVAKKMKELFKEAEDSAGSFSLMHDLMPSLSLSMAENGWKSDEDLNEYAFTKGLAQTFKREFFKSTYEGEVTLCPFTRHIGHIFNTVLELHEDGGVRVLPEERTGALPMFVAELIVMKQYDALTLERNIDLWLLTAR